MVVELLRFEAPLEKMLIFNGTILTLNAETTVIPNGALYYEGDTIVEVGPTGRLLARYGQADTLDAQGRLVMPGNICAHTHFYGAFARGMAIPGEPPPDFPAILEQLWWKLDRALTPEACQASAAVALVDAIRHGTTTLIDHHASPNAIGGSLDALSEAVIQAGLRVGLCYEVSDRNGLAGAAAGIDENVRWLQKIKSLRKAGAQESERLGASFGLHASFTLSDETLQKCIAAVDDLDCGFHIHLAEDMADERHSLQHYGIRTAERLARHGILGDRTLVAHCVHVTEAEMDILANTKTLVSHQPRSNMNNAVGVAPIEALLQKGVTVGLGNDGFSNNMFTEMATCYLLHKVHQGDPRVMGADAVLEMSYQNNARIAALFFPKPVGVLAPGAYADIILLDYFPYTPLTDENYPWHAIFGLDGSYVTHTICHGQMLMQDRVLLSVDQEAIAAKAKDLSVQVWERAAAL
jgi:putative selenium metabolism protein SsnA